MKLKIATAVDCFIGNSCLIRYIFFVIVATVTILFLVFYSQYHKPGPELLANAEFTQGLDHWHRTQDEHGRISLASPGTVAIRNGISDRSVSLWQSITDLNGIKFLRLSGSLKTENVNGGPKKWHKARLVLFSFDTNGSWVVAPHVVAELISTHGWLEYSEVFPIPAQAKHIEVVAQLSHATGTMWIKNLNLAQVHEKPLTFFLKALVIVLWGLLLGWIFGPYIAKAHFPGWRIAIIFAATALFVGTFATGQLKTALINSGYQLVDRVLISIDSHNSAKNTVLGNKPSSTQNHPNERARHLTKTGHFLVFVTLAILFVLTRPANGHLVIAFDLLIVAASTEWLQTFISGRSPSSWDFAIDSAGVLTGLVLAWCWNKYKSWN